jgi:Icc-related predicted phosphoesterase
MMVRRMEKLRIFFATDVHGSEACWLKLTNAWKYYKTNVVILGGDLTGKELVPIVEQGDKTYRAEVDGILRTAKAGEELEKLNRIIRNHGSYAYPTSESGFQELKSNPSKRSEIFLSLMKDRLEHWVSVAEERLKSSDVQIYVTGGNDDEAIILDHLKRIQSERVIDTDSKVVQIANYEMCSSGYSNMTPWKCPRDVTEEELREKIRELTTRVSNMELTIFNFHCPPFKTGLDNAPLLDENLRPKIGPSGGPIIVPVGSVAVREAIEKDQPLLGVHGHIHESRGHCKINRTLCINPGSEYDVGILRGAIIELEDRKVKSFNYTST